MPGSDERCRKPGCGAQRLLCTDYDCPQIWVHHTEHTAALASRDKEIERLTERCAAYKGQVEAGAAEIERLKEDHAREVEDLCDTASANLGSMLEQRALAATATRERDEARAEVERKDAALTRISDWIQRDLPIPTYAATTMLGVVLTALDPARAALHPEGAKDGQS